MKETKVYMDELPKSCSKCEWCTLNHKDNYGRPFCLIARMPLYNGNKIYEEKGQHKDSLSDFDCPLKSLHEHDKELVAKVLEKIKMLAKDNFDFDMCNECGEFVHNDNVLTESDFNKILNQIQGEVEDEIQKEFEDEK